MTLKADPELMDVIFQLAQAVPESPEAIRALTETMGQQPAGGGERLLITVFVLAVYVGAEIIARIPPTLHTPLMSGSNAISGIAVLGAMLATGSDSGGLASVLGFLGIVLATVNVVGGFVVTDRMLAMFKSKK